MQVENSDESRLWRKEVMVELKEWECVEVEHHKDVGKTIEQWQKNGWRLHTYTCTQYGMGGDVHHHILFEKGE